MREVHHFVRTNDDQVEITNLGVNMPLLMENPPTLSTEELNVLALGDRFIPAKTHPLSQQELDTMMDKVTQKAAVLQLFQSAYIPPNIPGTLIPYFKAVPGNRIMPEGELVWALSNMRSELQSYVGRRQTTQLRYNISYPMHKAIMSLRANTGIVIRPADKNLGSTIMTTEWYEKACLAHLEDASTYQLIASQLSDEGITQRTAYAQRLVHYKYEELLKYFEVKLKPEVIFGDPNTWRLPRFYIIPKLHKITETNLFVGRPIVSQVDSPTSRASQLLSDFLVTVIGMNHEWILQDTLNFIQDLDRLQVPQDRETWLVSFDVVSLYPSMDRSRVREAVSKAVAKHIAKQETEDPHINYGYTERFVQELLAIVLDFGYFLYPNSKGVDLYKQKTGAAMGVKCIPPCANLFMAEIMVPFIERHRSSLQFLLYLKGFVDDSFGVFVGSKKGLDDLFQEMNSLEQGIQFTYEASHTEVAFLDLLVFKGPRFEATGLLDYRPYAKKLNKFLYIPRSSAHPRHMLSSYIPGEAKRLIRNSTSESDAVEAVVHLIHNLVVRGYPADLVLHSLRTVSYQHRADYLTRKSHTTSGRVLSVNTVYRPSVESLPFRKHLSELERILGNGVKVVMGWKTEQNLQSLLHKQWPTRLDLNPYPKPLTP
jgi:hypothetical protein